MIHKTKRILTIALHVLFWAFVAFRFCNFSALRPLALHTWKELIAVGLITVMVYFNYFISIPHLLSKNRAFLFWVCAAASVVVCTGAEMLLVRNDMLSRMQYVEKINWALVWYDMSVQIFLRDAAFFLFFFLLKMYHTRALQLKSTGRAVMEKTDRVVLFLPKVGAKLVSINDISYFSYEDAKTCIYLRNGEKYEQYCSLNAIEDSLPDDTFLRINRHTIIGLVNVLRFSPREVQLNIQGQICIMEFYSTKGNEVLSRLKRWNPELYIDHPFGVLADTAEPLVELNREQRELLQYVKNNPGAKTGDVADQFHLSESSAKRRLNELKCLDLVAYRGSRGFDSGYYATSTKDI